jgi:hypothetical protein
LRLFGGFEADLLVLLAVDLVLGFLRGSLVLEFEAEVFEFRCLFFFGEGLDFFGGFGEVLVTAGSC